MDRLVNSLPNMLQQSSAALGVINVNDEFEGNICTTIQVNSAKDKGWKVLSYNENESYPWVDYEGSAPTGISRIDIGQLKNKGIVYDLNGRRNSKPQRGINILGNKKVLVKRR